jgi:hypothetical protein
VRLRSLGRDERWLQDQLAVNPRLLGLGDVTLVAQELHQTGGGYLDLLFARDDVYFSVEVQLEGVDASHAFRALEYWTRNRARWPERRHVAVMVAEQINTRYGTALRSLAADLPLVVIELGVHRQNDQRIDLTFKIVAAHADLCLEVEPMTNAAEDRTSESWKAQAKPLALAALEELERFVTDQLGPSAYLDYSTVSYIGVHRGRKLWATVRLLEGGIAVDAPEPDGARHVGPYETEAFKTMRDACGEVGVALRWQPSGDGGLPVGFRLRPGDLANGHVEWALRACWEALEDAEPFSKRYWSREKDDWYYANEETGFEPYYTIEYSEVDYASAAGYTRVDYFATIDEWKTLWSVPDDEWDDTEFARRVIVHLTSRQPTKAQIREFLRGPMADWEPGDPWAVDARDLAEWAHEHGP